MELVRIKLLINLRTIFMDSVKFSPLRQQEFFILSQSSQKEKATSEMDILQKNILLVRNCLTDFLLFLSILQLC